MADHSASASLQNFIANSQSDTKPVSMKLFASWEVDKTSSSCIPRLCMFNLTNLLIKAQLDNEDCQRVVIAVRMHGSKRMLRSGEIPLSGYPSGVPLDISISMQYAHFLKRDINNLRIALQRRKKYKNKTFLGYKTIAYGTVNLSQVLQSPKDLELELRSPESKEKHRVIGSLSLHNVTSKPVSYEDGKNTPLSGTDRSPESDEEEEDMLEDELSGEESLSDEDTRPSDTPRGEQSKFKQKISRLLRRFKTSDDAEKHILKALEQDQSPKEVSGNPRNEDDLFDDLEDLSEESDNEHDNISILSTPKPRLPTYFSKSSLDTVKQGGACESDRESVTSYGFRAFESANELPQLDSTENPRAATGDDTLFQELVSSLANSCDKISCEGQVFKKLFKSSHKELPDVVYLIDERASNSYYQLAHYLHQALHKTNVNSVLRITDKEDFRQFLKQMFSGIQTFCNNNAKEPSPIKLVLVGGDNLYNQFLDEFVKVFSEKSIDWLSYIRLLPVPLGASCLCRTLSSVDPMYNQVFYHDSAWLKLAEKAVVSSSTGDITDMIERLLKFVSAANAVLTYPICEAMVVYRNSKEKMGQQLFLPFLTEVLIGSNPSSSQAVPPISSASPAAATLTAATSGATSVSAPIMIPGSGEIDDVFSTSPVSRETIVSSHTERSGSITTAVTAQVNPSSQPKRKKSSSGPPSSSGNEPCELQIDYWIPNKAADKPKTFSKESLKGYFRFIQVQREKMTFRLIAANREKKAKMIRIGKKSKEKSKDKDSDIKSQSMNKDGITRIVCTAKDSADSLHVFIDQVEHSGVHYFQLSTNWQTHIKNIPIAVSKQYQSLE